MFHVRLDATLRQCPLCRAPLIVIDGTIQGSFWITGGSSPHTVKVTPHTEDCALYQPPAWVHMGHIVDGGELFSAPLASPTPGTPAPPPLKGP